MALFADKLWTTYGPTPSLGKIRKNKIAASSLKDGTHFTERNGLDLYVVNFKDRLKTAETKYFDGSIFKNSSVHVASCALRVLKNCVRLLSPSEDASTRIRNEAELRYAVGDPIMEFICDVGCAKVKLEESVKHSSATAGPSTSTQDAPSTPPLVKLEESVKHSSASDYSIYTIRSESGSLLAVVIETKLDARSTDVRAQVMGYVAAFAKYESCPPMALVITEAHIHVCLFPFVTEESNRLLIGCWCKENLWIDNEIDKKLVSFVGFLSVFDNREELKVTVSNTVAKAHEEMRNFIDKIETQTETLLKDNERLRKRDEEREATMRELEATMREREAVLQEEIGRLKKSRKRRKSTPEPDD